MFLATILVLSTGSGASLGFNAKANVEPDAQITKVEAVLAKIPSTVTKGMTIRISGGTRSQIDFPKDWSDRTIRGWVRLQKRFGFGITYTINGNDSPANQLAFVRKMQDEGVRFVFLELMNEYYLRKYVVGDTSNPDVTRKVTVTDYINEIVPTYVRAFEPLRLPMFAIMAPRKQVGGGPALTKWNEAMTVALNGKLKPLKLGVAVHIYKKNTEAVDYSQLDTLRASLPKGTPIAVTESGVIDATNESANAKMSAELIRAIDARLKPGDYLMTQILYKPEPGMEGCIGRNGITAKGTAVLDTFISLGSK